MASTRPSTQGPQAGAKESAALTPKEIQLVKWEEWALSCEEHFHAVELWQRNPKGQPMGHR